MADGSRGRASAKGELRNGRGDVVGKYEKYVTSSNGTLQTHTVYRDIHGRALTGNNRRRAIQMHNEQNARTRALNAARMRNAR